MIGSAMRRPTIHAGIGSRRAELDDRRPHHRERPVAAALAHRELGHRLAHRVDVGPAQRAGVGAAVLDEPGVDPAGAHPLDLGAGGGHPRRPDATARAVGEAAQPLRRARLRLEPGAHRLRGLELGAPVEGGAARGGEPAGAALGDEPAAHPADVGGGDVDEGGPCSGAEHGLDEADGAADVGAQGDVEGAVEGHLGGGVNDDVDVAERLDPLGVEAEAWPAEVAAERRQPGAQRRLPALAEATRGAARSARAASTSSRTLRARAVAAGPHQGDDPASGDGAQQLLEDRGAEKTGDPGEKHLRARQIAHSHRRVR